MRRARTRARAHFLVTKPIPPAGTGPSVWSVAHYHSGAQAVATDTPDDAPVVEWSVTKGANHMVFEVGETVVYPHHGAARIEEIKMRTVKGEEKMYLKLKVAQGDLTIEVPAENVDLVGVRDVVDSEGLEHVVEVLQAEHVEEPTNWSRRYKANLEKLASGDVNKVAEVVRDLWRRDHDRGLSAGEKRMLAKARQVLVSELALAKKVSEEEAEGILDKTLEG